MTKFLSCDWGTSSFRLRLVDTAEMFVEAEERNNQGIFNCYTSWKQQENNDEAARVNFFLNILLEQIRLIELKTNQLLSGIPVIISGMASSNIGMMPLPYAAMPFATNGAGLVCRKLKRNKNFEHDVLLISGIRSDDDVMRGEETQLIGCTGGHEDNTKEKVFIFPGTHSKHIIVKNNQVVAFNTYMTGEFFALLSEKSILSSTVEKTNGRQTDAGMRSFLKGVSDSSQSNLLHNCFKVRTNNLFNKLTSQENYHYLSGLIIGTELRELLYYDPIQIYLCGGSVLQAYYNNALAQLGLGNNVHAFSPQWVEEAVVRGQLRIYQNQVENE